MLDTNSIQSWDERRDLIILDNAEKAVQFAVEHWIHSAQRAIQQRGRFAVALSGGSTPKAIYQQLAQCKDVEWDKVFLFWSDERSVPPNHSDSNYHMAMESGLKNLSIPKDQIFRMKAEDAIEKNAIEYEEIIRRHLGKKTFDLVMLGVGEDGHTASLFPDTSSLTITDRLVAAVHLPKQNTWRMTLTFPCIEQSFYSVVYAIGNNKQEIVSKVLEAPIISPWPASRLGTSQHKTLWVLDARAAGKLKKI